MEAGLDVVMTIIRIQGDMIFAMSIAVTAILETIIIGRLQETFTLEGTIETKGNKEKLRIEEILEDVANIVGMTIVTVDVTITAVNVLPPSTHRIRHIDINCMYNCNNFTF